MAPKSGAVKAETGECAAIPAILHLQPQYPNTDGEGGGGSVSSTLVIA
ncbi:MAG: hypothetical protein K2X10_03980 [Hyphomicrobiales bacterium]|nr:hypothetical protein [Hyphomicrobiales bacterium]